MKNEAIMIDQNATLPTTNNHTPVLAPISQDNPSQKNTEGYERIAYVAFKEGIANIRDNRILRKKIVESKIDTVSLDLYLQKSEYERIKSQLEEKELPSEERMYLEKRIETISDRVHETSQVYNANMNEINSKQYDIWKGIGICVFWFLIGFCGGRSCQSHC